MFRPIVQFVLVGLVVCGACAASFAEGDLVLPSVFGDGMVLQQGSYAPVWGKALPNKKVRVSLDGVRARTKADDTGHWLVELPTDGLSPGGPHTLTVKSKGEKREFTDVLIGEVWVCSGQSNMEWTLANSNNPEAEIAAANYPNLRLFKVARTVAATPQWDVDAEWMHCVPENAKGFSAVAYFFGRRLLQARPDTPVGLIQTSWGGTPAEAWTSMEKLASIDSLDPLLERWNTIVANYPEAQKQHEAQLAEWQKASEQAKAEGNEAPPRPRPPLGPDHPHRTATLFNGMVNPLVPYGIRGAIWYQGESNAGRAHQYRTIFPAMITDWREQWGQGDFPFLFVQLANFRTLDTWPVESDWAELREAQSMTLDLPNTGQAVIIDIGEADDIHPRNKQDVGARLAQSAFKVAYGLDVPDSGPVYKSMEKAGNKIRLSFDHVHSGLTALGRDALYGFSIAGADKEFHWAWGEIDGDEVVVWSEDVPDPVAVRYGWANNPVCNLYNKDGLPASPFRTDDWEGITVGNN
jgi:sialate O-acetylesterase